MLPPDTDTGLTFVTKDNVGPYQSSSTTYEGSTGATKPTLVPAVRSHQEPDRHYEHLTGSGKAVP